MLTLAKSRVNSNGCSIILLVAALRVYETTNRPSVSLWSSTDQLSETGAAMTRNETKILINLPLELVAVYLFSTSQLPSWSRLSETLLYIVRRFPLQSHPKKKKKNSLSDAIFDVLVGRYCICNQSDRRSSGLKTNLSHLRPFNSLAVWVLAVETQNVYSHPRKRSYI